jgi:tRNA (adenine37-N6)-methyltransferase
LAQISFEPVAIVRSPLSEPTSVGSEDLVSEVVVREDLVEALDGIEGYSHLIILTWMDRVGADKRSLRRIHPKDRADLPLVGVFATRTQYRPNPVGLTTVRLLDRDGRVLRVQGLDAIDGTPVIDIKPYSPRQDVTADVEAPEWVYRL